MSGKSFKIAIVGATGAVGREMIDVLEKRNFPISDCLPFASSRSQGKKIKLQGREFTCQVLSKGCFAGVDFAFFDASDEVSKEWVPEALSSGGWVIDNSGTHRMNPEVELVVPEVNSDRLVKLAKEAQKNPSTKKLIAGPNCTTIQLVTALKPISDRYGLKRVVVSTYQSVSGAGTEAMNELKEQLIAAAVSPGKKLEAKALRHPIAFNLIPHIGSFDSEGYTSEEKKVIAETRKIMGLPNLPVSCTAVRVPTLSCHAESVNLELSKPFASIGEIRSVLAAGEGVVVQDEPSQALYPMNLTGSGQDPVYVGRLRKDPSAENGLHLWVVSDNLRKGAALNAVQIAERIVPHLS